MKVFLWVGYCPIYFIVSACSGIVHVNVSFELAYIHITVFTQESVQVYRDKNHQNGDRYYVKALID